MANLLLPRTPYIGSLVQKILDLHPELDAPSLIRIIRHSTVSQNTSNDGFTRPDIVDEAMAFRLAKELCTNLNSSR